MKIRFAAVLCMAMASPSYTADSAGVRTCRNHVQGKIDVVDARMHKGPTSDEAKKLVHRREKLRDQYKSCDRNPNAFKKDI
jgi:hypothetical protein